MFNVLKQSHKISNVFLNSNKPCITNTFSLYNKSRRNYHYKGIWLHPGPGQIDLDDGAQKPDGVPETWTAMDIGWEKTDFGFFDEDTFPPAIEGETLEDYCRRVPNIWSPCSRASDVVDMQVYLDLVWAQDWGPPRCGMLEEALIKLPPESADWHVTYVPDYEAMLKEMMFRSRPFPIKVKPEEFEVMLSEFERGIKEKGIGYHFKSRCFHDFWEELTDKPLQSIADVNTWEQEIDRRIEIAKKRNAAYYAEEAKRQLGDGASTTVEQEPEKVKVESS